MGVRPLKKRQFDNDNYNTMFLPEWIYGIPIEFLPVALLLGGFLSVGFLPVDHFSKKSNQIRIQNQIHISVHKQFEVLYKIHIIQQLLTNSFSGIC